MDHIYAELMNKNSNSNTQKYKILSCQKTATNNIDTSSWIDLKEIIKKIMHYY